MGTGATKREREGGGANEGLPPQKGGGGTKSFSHAEGDRAQRVLR